MEDYAPLRFRFADFSRELKAIQSLTQKRFFDASASVTFSQLHSALQNLQAGRQNRAVRWEVSENDPLRTVATDRYEPGGRRGGLTVMGEVSWCWELRNCLPDRGPVKEFEVCGNASIKLRIRGEVKGSEQEMAMWRVECGANDSPGCYFHTQILGEHGHPPFPKTLPVPRLPTLFVTPMAVIEYFLGELFQDEWSERVVGNHGDLPFWKRTQQERLQQLFQWKLNQIEACDGSPWLALKKAKPKSSDRLFVGGN